MKRFLLNLPIARLFLLLSISSISFLLIIGAIVYLMVIAQQELEHKYEQRYTSYMLADELRQNSDDLTRFARLYVVTGDKRFEQYYMDILAIQDGEKPRPEHYERIYWDFVANNKQKPRADNNQIALNELMRQQGFSEEEFLLLQKSKTYSDDLVNTEVMAMDAVKGIYKDSTGTPDLAYARKLMHDERYLGNVAKIMKPIDDFFILLDKRTSTEVTQYRNRMQTFISVLVAMLLVTAAVMIGSFMIIRFKIVQPIKKIYNVALGGFSDRIQIDSHDEVGVLSRTINDISDDIQLKTDFVKQIGTGNLNQSLTLLNKEDLLGRSLLKMKDDLLVIREEERKRNWASDELARFGEMLRQTTDFTKLCEKFISNLVKSVNANQGAVFLVKNDTETDGSLELVSCYAYERKKYVNKTIHAGEGLIGQVYLEKRYVYLKKVPDGYIHITSGLGESMPSVVLIMPIMAGDRVEGVVELASFTELALYKIEFIEKVSESIASVLSTMRTNQRTQELLAESQYHAEQMKAQEEELRQNLEELSATQEEIKRKEKYYLEKIQDLEIRVTSKEIVGR